MRKAVSSLLIIAGFAIVCYPALNHLYSQYMQEKALRELEQSTMVGSIAPRSETEQGYIALEQAFQAVSQEQVNPAPAVSPPLKPTALGILTIPKISLRMPIYYGTSNAILNIGVGQIEGTTPIGEVGNTALSAHRSQTYGHQFNRLDEVQVGDEFTIKVDTRIYTYRVYKVLLVDPTDTSVLNRNNRDRVVTLITCHPIHPATHRLIIHALQVEP